MVAICPISEVSRSINTTAEELIKKYEEYAVYTGEDVDQNSTTVLYENTAILNHFIHSPEIKDKITILTYPNIADRIKKNGFITPYEVESFVEQSVIYDKTKFMDSIFLPESMASFREIARDIEKAKDIESITDILVFSDDDTSKRLALEEFNYYLGSLFKTDESVSSFCEMVPNIFEKINRFVHVFNGFKKIAGYISEGVDKIKSKLAGKSFEQLEQIVVSYVKKTFKEQMDRLKRFVIKIQDEYNNITKRISAQFIKLKEKAENFFSEENLNDIVNMIKTQIKYVLDFFKDPDIEEIQYIIYRFCTLLSTLKHVFNSQINPLSKAVQAFNETNLALKSSSGLATSGALRAGAIRFEPQQYDTVKKEQFNFITQRSEQEQGNYNPKMIEISAADIEGVTPWNNGQGDSRVGFQGRWVTVLKAPGWNGVLPNVKLMLMQVQANFGKRLLVNSGFRTPEYNRSLRGSAKGSLHMSGMALDITWAGYSLAESKSTFVPICKQVGFRGFGFYPNNNFTHIDIGGMREWTTYN